MELAARKESGRQRARAYRERKASRDAPALPQKRPERGPTGGWPGERVLQAVYCSDHNRIMNAVDSLKQMKEFNSGSDFLDKAGAAAMGSEADSRGSDGALNHSGPFRGPLSLRLRQHQLSRRRARLPASPPTEKAAARQDQAGQAGADDGAGNGSGESAHYRVPVSSYLALVGSYL